MKRVFYGEIETPKNYKILCPFEDEVDEIIIFNLENCFERYITDGEKFTKKSQSPKS